MNFKCLFGHQWNDSCKCERCGEIRDEMHNWIPVEGKCIENCSVCGEERTIAHKWNGCKCRRCETTRDVGHEWVLLNKHKGIEKLCSICKKEVWHNETVNESMCKDGEHIFIPIEGKCYSKCSICGKVQYMKHQFNGCKCSRCGWIEHSYVRIPVETLPSGVQSEINTKRYNMVGVVTEAVAQRCSRCGDIKWYINNLD